MFKINECSDSLAGTLDFALTLSAYCSLTGRGINEGITYLYTGFLCTTVPVFQVSSLVCDVQSGNVACLLFLLLVT